MNYPLSGFSEAVFQPEQTQVSTLITLEMQQPENIGQGVIRVEGKANGISCKRLTQESWGHMVNEIPVWHIEGRIVADWFAELLENTYQASIKDKVIIIK